jgi:hypothetical protein
MPKSEKNYKRVKTQRVKIPDSEKGKPPGKRRGRPPGSKNKPKIELVMMVSDFWKKRGRYGRTAMRQAEADFLDKTKIREPKPKEKADEVIDGPETGGSAAG